MIVRYDRERWLQRIGRVLAEWTDAVVPGQVEVLASSTYSPIYAWMFTYEKALKRRIEAALGKPLASWERRLFGGDGALSEGLSNAFLHGHKREMSIPIDVACVVGRRGLALSVTDRGPGFDSEAILAKARSGGHYYHMAGNGLRCFVAAADLDVAFTDGGRTTHLLVRLSPQGLAAPTGDG
jgi:hypothetical protein